MHGSVIVWWPQQSLSVFSFVCDCFFPLQIQELCKSGHLASFKRVKLYQCIVSFHLSCFIHDLSLLNACFAPLHCKDFMWNGLPSEGDLAWSFMFYVFLLIFIIQLINLCLSGTGCKWNMDFFNSFYCFTSFILLSLCRLYLKMLITYEHQELLWNRSRTLL